MNESFMSVAYSELKYYNRKGFNLNAFGNRQESANKLSSRDDGN